MEHVTANNEAKWASSFFLYSQFVFHRKLVTDHPKHSLGSGVITPRISGEKFHLEVPPCPKLSFLHKCMLKEHTNNPTVLYDIRKSTASSQAPLVPQLTIMACKHGRASPTTRYRVGKQVGRQAGKLKGTHLTGVTNSQSSFMQQMLPPIESVWGSIKTLQVLRTVSAIKSLKISE